ncbi:MAG TPA: cation:proton antiporter, partial [Ilumatobacteraceae bacterium]|nr:cation:proton antiporter [Ilumatobacteraceae bacterium]
LAGVLLSESTFRHQIEADIEPFRGILLGLFFLGAGMALDLAVVAANWPLIVGAVLAMMVVKANKYADGIGGHLSTFASSASLYDIGFNHFFRGKDDGNAGDHIYIQGHAAPGIYARAYMEGRLTEDDLDHFRREIGRDHRGLSSYPHPRLMPAF